MRVAVLSKTLTKYIVFLLMLVCISFWHISSVSAYYQLNKTTSVSFATATYQNLSLATDKTTYGLCNKTATILLTVGNTNNYSVGYTITFSNSNLTYTIDGVAVSSYTLLSGGSKTHTIVVSGTTSTTGLTINVVPSNPYASIHNKEVTLDLICPQCTWGGGQFY